MKRTLQLALDFVDLPRAVKVAREAVAAGVENLEAGTPLIKSCGLEAVRVLRKEFPAVKLVADLKVMDTGRLEAEMAFKAGADVVVVLAAASDETIREAVEASRNYGGQVMVDLMEESARLDRACSVEKLGIDYLGVHLAIDEQMKGKISFDFLRQVCQKVSLPVAVAGGLNSENVVEAVKAGASILIVGGAITKAPDVAEAVAKFRQAITTGQPVRTQLYWRADQEKVREVLSRVSTANLSDALHRRGWLDGIHPVSSGVKMVGPAITVRTYPGDWAKPVEAVDMAEAGQVIVIDAGGVPPAVWGELATHSCITKGVAGVVIHGAIRDVEDIRKMSFPAFAKVITPQAGEPKGLGEINVPLRFGKDWLY
ncbi:MAG: orotidine 5'-phosphate decarboxylase [Candidatus Omnitrophica bacterium]|nr:orotidine 5'-phosphate decarboxylase [Candidatus Omnitrophota bacterium]